MWNEAAGPPGLLESVAEELCCEYLSDLRGKARRLSLYITLKEFPAERFSSREWTDAAQYLTGVKPPGGLTAVQAKKLLLRRLNESCVMAQDAAGKRRGPLPQD